MRVFHRFLKRFYIFDNPVCFLPHDQPRIILSQDLNLEFNDISYRNRLEHNLYELWFPPG